MPGEAWGAIALVVVALITYLLAPYVKARIDDKKPADVPTPGDRALDQVFTDLQEARHDLDAEQEKHQVTREEYMRVSQRLAQVEAEAKYLRAQLRERDAAISALREEMRALRSEIADMRSTNGGS